LGEVRRIEDGLESLKQKRIDLKRIRRETEVAADIARHLDARNFERWLMAQVLELLCVGATSELRKLSNDAYSLTLDERNDFLVIDHRNADERRPVKTLSGGETFLASLSLALALSEHLADLAVGGAAKLEALFLDEGFGTLDSDTLDVVISAIEELGSHGRMVGVVTHVKELAESIPVRYEVTKQGNRSSIERIEA
jgi:exonuclease SbcC